MTTFLLSTFFSRRESTSLSNFEELFRFSRNLIPSAVSHQSSPVAWYPCSRAISLSMSPPPTRGTFSVDAIILVTVVLPTAGIPHIMIASNTYHVGDVPSSLVSRVPNVSEERKYHQIRTIVPELETMNGIGMGEWATTVCRPPS